MILIHKSPILLAIKIILLEILIELTYLVITGLAQIISQQTGFEIPFISPLTQLLLLPLQLAVLVTILIRWASETYEIQGKELIVRQGVFNRVERAYPYNNMQSVIVKQSVIERLIGAGTISVYVPTLGKELVFSEVPDPKLFAEKLKEAIPYSEKSQFIMRK